MKKINKKHVGTSLDSFLQEDGILEKTETMAIKRVIALQLLAILEQEEITQTELAHRLGTSKAAVNRLLDPEHPSLTLNTLVKVANVLGREVRVSIG